MATIQDQEQAQQNVTNPINAPTVAGTSAPVGTVQGGQGAAGAPAVNQNPVSPVSPNLSPQDTSGYTDVSAYLSANQAGGQQIGNMIGQNLTNQYNQITGDINTSAQNAVTAAGQGYTPSNTDLISQVAANPTAAASNPEQLAAFQAQLNDAYTGPSSWADLGTLQGEVSTGQTYGNLINTPGGANTLIQDVENKTNPGQTSQGINALDTLLFNENPAAFQTAATAAQPYSTLSDYLNSQNTNVANAITGGQTAAAQAASNALNAFTGPTGTLTNLNTDVTNATKAAQIAYGNARDDQTALFNMINSGTLTPGQLSALGMTPDQYAALNAAETQANTSVMTSAIPAPPQVPVPNPKYPGGFEPLPPPDPRYGSIPNFDEPTAAAKVNLSPYLTATPATPVQAATIGTPDQYAQTAAINQLLGTQAPLQTEALNPAMSALAGQPQKLGSTAFDYSKALAAVNALTQKEYQDALNYRYQEALAATGGSGTGNGFADFFGGLLAHGGEVPEISTYLDKQKKAN